jgi:hypothetical protein
MFLILFLMYSILYYLVLCHIVLIGLYMLSVVQSQFVSNSAV